MTQHSQIVDEKTMRKMAVAPPEPDGSGGEKPDTDEELDEELDDTFPASDPPAITQPGHEQPDPHEDGKSDKP